MLTALERGVKGGVWFSLIDKVYLNDLDHLMADRGFEMTRYADDMVVQCRTAAEAETALATVRDWVDAHKLTLHPTKTKVVDVREDGFDFLGYHFRKNHRWPRKKSLARFRATICAKTRRTDGRSIDVIVRDVNKTLRGWFEYFKHSNRHTFSTEDGWVRMRLRSLLRKRRGLRGRGRGADHQRWPNAYFTALGYFSLVAAHAAIRRSPSG